MKAVLLVVIAIAAVSATECFVKHSETTGYTDFCSNGEICTSVGCRCLPGSSCFHAPSDATFCGAMNSCTRSDGSEECCRSGEKCVIGEGCRCSTPLCAPPVCNGTCLESAKDSLMPKTMIMKLNNRLECWRSGECQRMQASAPGVVGAAVPCTGGYAGQYPCKGIRMESQLSFTQLGCSYGTTQAEGNDIWGWTHGLNTQTERDFALVGCTTGTSFVEITDPVNPKVLGFLPTPSSASTWRDIKVYKDFAFIVTEARNSGMQVFNLTHLLSVANPGPSNQFKADAWYTDQMGTTAQRSTHNIAIDEYIGRAYLVGCKTCSGGLLMVDITTPMNPQYAGCYSGDGYTHDTQCVYYNQPSYPDERFKNKEICYAFNEDTLTIVDATDPTKPVMLSRTGYAGNEYCHQGWSTPDQYYLLVDDELDEMYDSYDKSKRTNTYLWDISDLTLPFQLGVYQSPAQSIDHNQYVYGRCSFQSNYASGLRVLRLPANFGTPGVLPEEVAYFDVDPDTSHGADFYGAWSVFADYHGKNKHTVVVDSIERGLFVLHVDKAGLNC